MAVTITEEGPECLAAYATVPIAFTVKCAVVIEGTLATPPWELQEVAVTPPFEKDYDAYPGNSPCSWAERFDVSRWRFFSAALDGRRVGGAVVIFGAPDVEMLEGRDDTAVLWDLRVAPDLRGMGIGTRLIAAAEGWVASNGGRWLKVETQNINVPACRLYARTGFVLSKVTSEAYPEAPWEIQLVWSKTVSANHAAAS